MIFYNSDFAPRRPFGTLKEGTFYFKNQNKPWEGKKSLSQNR